MIKDTIYRYISHLREKVIALNGYNPRTTPDFIAGQFYCGSQTATILCDLIDDAYHENIITEKEWSDLSNKVFELRNQLVKIHNGLIKEA